ncbi:hypothetical protein FC56_GL000271 [Lentilactobacillus senioris DSM 24302 = JCM 17472]|uniref:Uncharacterized protein n=1 Tax=Lentilactobacillus senioris DSM 24302 = JCM 17472 TaxID=1423802 RepID=A0A0R2D061_9LACO|nr:hypothetical protein [Lentilactobacillus senioris]KRM93558.1 hypothetical protein FC56_GL000271 [Lentilactobacillus senioris DSM 24302 = JCM 17472]
MKYEINSMADWSAITPAMQTDLYDNYGINFSTTYRLINTENDNEPGGQLTLKTFSGQEIFDAPITISDDEKGIVISDRHRDFFIHTK